METEVQIVSTVMPVYDVPHQTLHIMQRYPGHHILHEDYQEEYPEFDIVDKIFTYSLH